jgi:L-aminopeptidase/D-esterase-like protein
VIQIQVRYWQVPDIAQKHTFADTLESMKTFSGKMFLKFAGKNTVIGVVATNAKLSKEDVNKGAQMAQDGIARTIRPAHTMFDGDTLFSLSTGNKRADVNLIGAYAAKWLRSLLLTL